MHEVNHPFRTWGFIFLFGFLIPAIAAQSFFFDPEREGGALLGLIALAAAPLAWGLLWEARTRIRISPHGIDFDPRGGRRRQIRWNEIESVGYSAVLRLLVIRQRGEGRPLRVSLLRSNVDALARALLEHLPPEAFTGAARPLFGIRPRDPAGPPTG